MVVRILLANIKANISTYRIFCPFVLLTMLWLPCFIVLVLVTRENEKIQITEWTTWMDDKMADPRY